MAIIILAIGILLYVFALPIVHFNLLKKTVGDESVTRIKQISYALLVSYSPAIAGMIAYMLPWRDNCQQILCFILVTLLVFALECYIVKKFNIKRLLVYAANTMLVIIISLLFIILALIHNN